MIAYLRDYLPFVKMVLGDFVLSSSVRILSVSVENESEVKIHKDDKRSNHKENL